MADRKPGRPLGSTKPVDEWKCKTCGSKQPARLTDAWCRCTFCGSPDIEPIVLEPVPV